jgi:hypothetical protein
MFGDIATGVIQCQQRQALICGLDFPEFDARMQVGKVEMVQLLAQQ